MNKETKQCRECLKEKPLKDFAKNRAICKPCRALALAQSKVKKQSEQPQPEQPPVHLNANGDIALDQLFSSEFDAALFDDRGNAENYIKQKLITSINRYDQLAQSYLHMAGQATSRKERKELLAKVETANKNSADLQFKLIKEFGFFADLAKPDNDDPLYTPVNLFLNTELPASCIVEPPFQIQPDELQPVESPDDGDG